MCGIIGYTGASAAIDVLTTGLSVLAYRGYDSAGVVVAEEGLRLCRAAGKLERLYEKMQGEAAFTGCCGLGHTRWATHGAANESNAHPHVDTARSVAVVHNGIIENGEQLREELTQLHTTFVSETDTEVIPHLLANMRQRGQDPLSAIEHTTARLCGTYALGIIFADAPDQIYAVRQKSPLVVAVTSDGAILASDVGAILPYTREVYYPEEGEVICLSPKGISIHDATGWHAPRMTHVEWERRAAERGGYRQYMEKELYEAPDAVGKTIALYENDVNVPPEKRFSSIGCMRYKEIYFVGCGSAYHVGLLGAWLFEERLGIRARAETASEFRYRHAYLSADALVVVISQSGETADTLAALECAHARDVATLAIVNVPGSAIARAADYVLYTHAGPEIAVATTKAYCAQVAAVWCLARIWTKDTAWDADLEKTSAWCREILDMWNVIKEVSRHLSGKRDIFYIGRGMDAAVCREGALKLKEITYLHAEAYEAGELKHGTISLIEEGTPVLAVVTQTKTSDKMYANIREVQARGADVTVVAGEKFVPPPGCRRLRLPAMHETMAPLGAALMLDILAYEVCCGMGLEADMPRNLAKSVTVE